MLAGLRPDLVVAARRLLAQPGFTLLVVGFLALGIGATVTTFSLVETLLLRPLPYDHAERLARLYSSHPENGWDHFGTSVEDLLDWRDQSRASPRSSARAPSTARPSPAAGGSRGSRSRAWATRGRRAGRRPVASPSAPPTTER
jgi:hypothetical protein